MRNCLILILLAISFNTWAQKAKNTLVYKTVKSVYADLNNDGKTDTIILSNSTKDADGSFDRIAIKLAGFPKQTFKAKHYWVGFDSLFLKAHKNLVRTNLIFVKKTDKHAVVLLWSGTDGAGYCAEFSIINIENNIAKMVFDHDDTGDTDVEIPVELTDIENTGRLDFVYRITFQCSDVFSNGKICAYSPYFVYAVNDTCSLNKPLMKAYNQKHYVFDGYKYSEQIKIYYPDNGSRPSIWHPTKSKPKTAGSR